MFRALAVLRVLLLANTVALNVYRRDNFVHPTAGLVMTVVMAVWTVVAIWAYAAPRRRTPLLLGLDLAIALLMIALTPWVKGAGFNATVPGFWVMGAMLAWAIHWRLVGGAIASVCVVSTDLAGPRAHHPVQLRQRVPAADRRSGRRLPRRPAPAHRGRS